MKRLFPLSGLPVLIYSLREFLHPLCQDRSVPPGADCK
ncbi:unnamed protein product [Tetraodon nigroviridis]|uniref:(spotted green pufferfish) hypothetical protein n=1 Tax=Tetraodon nigroviridis TaxID=99883 RepID=Q4SMR1_TETNG|nr:unnamed protein product [Tetraodon nigroviridis]